MREGEAVDSFASRAISARVGGNLAPQRFGVFEPGFLDRFRDLVVLKRFGEYLFSASELSTHDPVRSVSFIEGASLVIDGSPEELSGELTLEAFEPGTVDLSEEIADHDVIENPPHEIVDDLFEYAGAAELFKKRGGGVHLKAPR